MKIILKEEITTDSGILNIGTVMDIPDNIAKQWIKNGKAKAVSKIEKAIVEPSEKRGKRKRQS